MDAVEYLKQRGRMCRSISHCATDCEFYEIGEACTLFVKERGEQQKAVEIVRRWADAYPVEIGIVLTAMERRFVRIYIDRCFLWAARDLDGKLRLYWRCPERKGQKFENTSLVVHSARTVMGNMFPGITWENSPVCLPKLLEVSKT